MIVVAYEPSADFPLSAPWVAERLLASRFPNSSVTHQGFMDGKLGHFHFTRSRLGLSSFLVVISVAHFGSGYCLFAPFLKEHSV